MTTVLVSGRVLDKQVGGNTRYARTLYEGLATYGVDHVVARPRIQGRLRSATYAVSEGVIWPNKKLQGIDVLHFPADTGAVVRGRHPIVGTVHGLATLHVEDVRSPLSDKIWRTRVGRLVSVGTKIITVSQSSADDIVKLFPGSASKVIPIHHGIDHQKFKPAGGDFDSTVVAELGVEAPYFLYLGNLDPRKNLLELAAAASKVFEQTGIPLVVAGSPAWESEAIVQAVTHTAGVKYIGRVPEDALVPLMRSAMAFCFPSSYEGFGFPVLEAMACGTPVICSGRGSLAEVAGGATILLEDISRGAIAAEMIRVSKDSSLRAQLSRAGIDQASKFRWDQSVMQHAQIFKEVA